MTYSIFIKIFIISFIIVLISEFVNSYKLRKKHAVRREVTPGERIPQLISKLSSSSQEIDAIIKDVVQDIKRRQTVLEELKARHHTLFQKEEELSKRVQVLNDLPLEAAKYFQQINEQTLQQMEKKRARRDILMFVLGIVVTNVIAILLRVFEVR